MSRPSTAPDFATDANYSSGPQSGSPNKVSPSAFAAQGWLPSDFVAAENQNFLFNNHALWINYEDLLSYIFGLGDDGALNLVGTPLTLTADKHYTSMSIDATSVLKTAGFRVFCSGTCTIAAGGIISCDGAAASGTVGGVGVNGSMFGGATGGGGTNSVGGNGSSTTSSHGGNGGLGGAGGSGGAGTIGTHALPVATLSSFMDLPGLITQFLVGLIGGTPTIAGCQGGAGGSGGGGAGGSIFGGGGGAGGGILLLVAHDIVNGGTITAKGGAGANGTGGAGNGGGGGGGGGTVIVVTRSLTGAGTLVVTGGAGGAGSLNNGATGSSGQSFTRTI